MVRRQGIGPGSVLLPAFVLPAVRDLAADALRERVRPQSGLRGALVLVKEKAYVGGMQVDRHDAKYLDFLLAVESSSDAVLIEIKTPSTTLLGSEYRGGVFPPSSELSGSIAQVLSYRATLVAEIDKIDKDRQLKVLSPRCAVIIGDAGRQLNTGDKRRSFELYRRALRDVELLTFDELFRKAAKLAEVFGLTVSQST